MQSTLSWVIAGTVGALMGAASMYYVVGDRNGQPSGSLVGMNQTETPPRDARMGVATTSVYDQTQGSIPMRRESAPVQNTKPSAPAAGLNTAAVSKPVPVDDEATVQILMARLHDPSFIYSTTLSDVMQSEDMRKLSDESRERVVQEMMGMINRGEIDARTFMVSRK